MRAETAYEKIKFCLKDVDEFKDLIQINETGEELAKRYNLVSTISGGKIKNRVENLIIACWSAKDWMKKDIEAEIDKATGKIFEKNLFSHDETELMQYLADAQKHGGIDPQYLKNNKYKPLEPKLEKTVLHLSNQSVPGPLKPVYTTEGDCVPAFDIQMVKYVTGDGQTHYNFDTILLTIKIVDNTNKYVHDAMSLVAKFSGILKREYNRIMRV